MAYTKTWNEASPADTDLVSGADDQFRDLKFATRERLSSIVGKDLTSAMNTDPIVPDGYALLDPKRYFPFAPYLTSPRPVGMDISVFGVVTDDEAGSQQSYCIPLDVTGESTLTAIKFYYTRPGDSVSMTYGLYSAPYGLGSTTLVVGPTVLPTGTAAPELDAVGPVTITPGLHWMLVVSYTAAAIPASPHVLVGVEFVYA